MKGKLWLIYHVYAKEEEKKERKKKKKEEKDVAYNGLLYITTNTSTIMLQ
jgi:hypothetical protein